MATDHSGAERRMGFFHITGFATVAVLASGCAIPGISGSAARQRTVELPFLVTAWLVADALRIEHGGADPLPAHAGAPVLRLSEDVILVRYDRIAGQGLRVHKNGRLLPPEPPRCGSVDADPVPQSLDGVRFEGAADRTGSLQAAEAGVTGSITSDEPGGTRVTVCWRGNYPAEPTWRHVSRLLQLAADVRGTGLLLAEGRYPETEKACALAIDRFASGCCADHRPLAARLWMHRAMAQRRMQQLDEALTSAEVARGWDPTLPALDLWVAELAERLGRQAQAEAAWLSVELRAPGRAARLGAARSRRRVQLLRTATESAPLLVADARRRFEDGDRESADYLLDRARMIEPYDQDGLDLLRRVHDARDDARRVLEISLLQSEASTGQPDAEVAVQLFRSWNRAGQPSLALRTLVRHWDTIAPRDPSAARTMLREQVERLGREAACRILASERAHRLLPIQLAAWAGAGGADRAAWSSLSFLQEKRTKAVLRGMDPQPPQPGK